VRTDAPTLHAGTAVASVMTAPLALIISMIISLAAQPAR
jgi:hypothetical protein